MSEDKIDRIYPTLEDYAKRIRGYLLATYYYNDESGEVKYAVLRFDPKTFRQARRVEGGWIGNLDGVESIPFMLSELLAADTSEWVIFTEGEKDVENLTAQGFVATTHSSGADGWRAEMSRWFKGRRVAILPDNDAPGMKHAARVAEDLKFVGARVKVVRLPGLQPKGDVSDWLQDHNGKELRALIESTPDWSNKPSLRHIIGGVEIVFPNDDVVCTATRLRGADLQGDVAIRYHGRLAEDARLVFSSLSGREQWARNLRKITKDVDWDHIMTQFCGMVLRSHQPQPEVEILGPERAVEPRRWLVERFLPMGVPTDVFGPAGAGKSTVAALTAVSVKTGVDIVGKDREVWQVNQRGNVLILDWEDTPDNWQTRIAAIARGAGIPVPLIPHARCRKPLVDDVETISRIIDEQDPLLIVLDSVGLASGSGRSTGSAEDTTVNLFMAISELSKGRDLTWLMIDQISSQDLREGSAPKAYGSIYKQYLARNVWELRPERSGDNDSITSRLIHNKVNHGRLLDDQVLTFTYIGPSESPDRIITSYEERTRGLRSPTHIPPATVVRMARAAEATEECGPLTVPNLAQEAEVSEGTVEGWIRRFPAIFHREGDVVTCDRDALEAASP